jgi:hypothetical protein
MRTSTEPVTRPRGSWRPLTLSKSVQPTIATATVYPLSSPQFGQFASYRVPEDRGVGSSILPLTTVEFGLLVPSRSPYRVSGRGYPQARHPNPIPRSGGGCSELAELLGWCHPAERFARPFVEFGGDGVELSVGAEVEAAG